MATSGEIKVTSAMLCELEALLAAKGKERFRRSDLAAKLYLLTNPRSRPRADALADVVIKSAARSGQIIRTGHQHWVRVATECKLRSGRTVPEFDQTVELPLITRCPDKWLSVDLETGQIWVGENAGWKRAPASVIAELKELLK